MCIVEYTTTTTTTTKTSENDDVKVSQHFACPHQTKAMPKMMSDLQKTKFKILCSQRTASKVSFQLNTTTHLYNSHSLAKRNRKRKRKTTQDKKGNPSKEYTTTAATLTITTLELSISKDDEEK